MVPAYIFVVGAKVVAAINVLINPFCYMRVLVLFNVLSVYSWTRVLIVIFGRLKIFPGGRYSVGLLVATAVCLPGMGPAVLLFFILFILAYVWSLRLYYGSSSWKFLHLLGENSSNPFDHSTFNALFTEGMA